MHVCLQEHRELLRPLVHDTVSYLHKVLSSSPGKLVVVEGAQATMLDIDFGECQRTSLVSAKIILFTLCLQLQTDNVYWSVTLKT